MKVAAWSDLLAGRESFRQPVRLSIGVFDGLHQGHRRLLKAITEGPETAIPLVITFVRSPAQVLAHRPFPGLILSRAQKLARFASVGISAVVEIDFSDEMSHLSGKAFISLLKENLTIEKIVVGYNFRFGRAREAGSGDLREMLMDTGIDVRVTDPVLRGDSIVSSSRIRKTIQEGDFAEARAMLLADYSIDLRGVGPAGGGTSERSIPRTAIEQVLPAPGRYAVFVESGGGRSAAEVVVGEDVVTLAGRDIADVTEIIFH